MWSHGNLAEVDWAASFVDPLLSQPKEDTEHTLGTELEPSKKQYIWYAGPLESTVIVFFLLWFLIS